MARAAGNRPQGRIRVGIGGWTYAPWRGTFYPSGLPRSEELAYACSRVSSIEVNGTFYRTQSRATFRKWAGAAPDGFKFSIKGPRYVTHRSVLAEAGDSLQRFIESGLDELGDKLGPLLWQFPPGKRFEEVDFGHFLALLPTVLEKRPLRHAVEVRHESFAAPAMIRLLRKSGVGLVFAEDADYPAMADVTGDFVYARLQKGRDAITTGYPAKALDDWARRACLWARGKDPDDLPRVDEGHGPQAALRDVFLYFIREGKIRAPAAAMALMERLGSG